MAWRTTSGRRDDTRLSAMASAHSALTLDRAELQVEGRQSWWAAIHRSSSSLTVRNGAARRTARYSANWVASSLRRSSASSSAPWNQNERWTVRPETGSTPTAIRISKTPGRRSRNDPCPQMPTTVKIGSGVGSPVDPYLCAHPRFTTLPGRMPSRFGALGGIRTPNLLIRICTTHLPSHTVTVREAHLCTVSWDAPRSHLTTTHQYVPGLSTVRGRLVLTAVLTRRVGEVASRSGIRATRTRQDAWRAFEPERER
jgi:hypothetical protein